MTLDPTTKCAPPDLVLSARLEITRLLADHLEEPVAVVDQAFRIVYANQAAYARSRGRGASESGKCYAAFFGHTAPCTFCPAERVLQTGTPQAIRCRIGDDAPEGVLEAFPLTSAGGQPVYVLEVHREVPFSVHTREGKSETPTGEQRTEQLGDLLGRSRPMQQLFEMIRLVAESEAPVLLQGESGTGKELVARTIHKLGPRWERPFIVVDCGSLPETLLESELFGHIRGAFTGARSSKRGILEEADGGTVFLDEVADTSGRFQSKLLRFLQEGEVRPVGSNRAAKVNVRVISATNKNLLELVKAKAFREDLYYRLAVLPLELPPLRERREDIPLLARHFLERSCHRHQKPLLDISPEAMLALMEAPWPGNVRELKHTIERVVVMATGRQLTPHHFFGLSSQLSIDAGLRSVARCAAESAERQRIQEALRQTAGKKTEAARLLKISRASLYNKLRAYGID